MSFSRRELLRRFGALIVVAPFVKPSSILAVEPTAIMGDILPPGFAYDLTDIPRASHIEFRAAPIADYEPPSISYEIQRRIEGKVEAGGVNLAALNTMISDDPYSWPVLSVYKTKAVGSPHHGFLIHDFSLTSTDYAELQ